MNEKLLKKHANNIRRSIMGMAYISQSAHVGGSLSCVDILTVLYFSIMKINPKKPYDYRRDWLIFSKAHDCKALYATLSERGFFNGEKLKTYEKNGGLPGHSTRHIVPGVEASAGSLGHGLSVAVGIAYAKSLDKKAQKVFAVLSDGECDEGSTWEAILFAGHHKLSNLIVIVDYNKLQAFGRTSEILELEPFAAKWEAFGWSVKEVDGHDVLKIQQVLKKVPFGKGKPSVLLAHTVKGYLGVKKHVDQVSSQYRPPSEEEYKKVLEGIK